MSGNHLITQFVLNDIAIYHDCNMYLLGTGERLISRSNERVRLQVASVTKLGFRGWPAKENSFLVSQLGLSITTTQSNSICFPLFCGEKKHYKVSFYKGSKSSLVCRRVVHGLAIVHLLLPRFLLRWLVGRRAGGQEQQEGGSSQHLHKCLFFPRTMAHDLSHPFARLCCPCSVAPRLLSLLHATALLKIQQKWWSCLNFCARAVRERF